LGIVELDDDVAQVDHVAIAHTQFGNNAAGRVLHLLHIGIDDELALRDHRAREFAGRGPAADAPDEEHHDTGAEQDVLPDSSPRIHDAVPRAPPTSRNWPPPAAAAAAA